MLILNILPLSVCVAGFWVWHFFFFFPALFWFTFCVSLCCLVDTSIKIGSSPLFLVYHKYVLYFSKCFYFTSTELVIFLFSPNLLKWRFTLMMFLKLN